MDSRCIVQVVERTPARRGARRFERGGARLETYHTGDGAS